MLKDKNLDLFLTQCQKIVRNYPSHENHDSVFYKDDEIEIVQKKQNDFLEVTVSYFSEDGKKVHNPAIMRLENGDLIRVHGDWRHKEVYVTELLEKLCLYYKVVADNPAKNKADKRMKV